MDIDGKMELPMKHATMHSRVYENFKSSHLEPRKQKSKHISELCSSGLDGNEPSVESGPECSMTPNKKLKEITIVL